MEYQSVFFVFGVCEKGITSGFEVLRPCTASSTRLGTIYNFEII